MATETPLPNIFNQEQKDAIRQLVLSTLTNYADVMRIQSGNIESGNFDEINAKGWKIDSNGVIKATQFIDTTYGYNGVFTKVFSTTSTTGSTTYTIKQNGGLIGILVNMLDTGSPDPSFIDVSSWNGVSVNWECIVSGGNYIITIYNSNINIDYFPLTKVFTTVFFNSLETEGF